MRDKSQEAASLYDMLTAAKKISRYVIDKTPADYHDLELLRDAVERNLEIIGEAARRISEEFKLDHPEIPWRKIIAQRNVLAHEYEHIDNDEIWQVATVHIPAYQYSRTAHPALAGREIAMSNLVENPIINSAFEEPILHHLFEKGEDPIVEEGRRPVQYIMARRERHGGAAEILPYETLDGTSRSLSAGGGRGRS